MGPHHLAGAEPLSIVIGHQTAAIEPSLAGEPMVSKTSSADSGRHQHAPAGTTDLGSSGVAPQE
jgi:hypothetical protein